MQLDYGKTYRSITYTFLKTLSCPANQLKQKEEGKHSDTKVNRVHEESDESPSYTKV